MILSLQEMHFSFKHNGLYLYFSRLVRPVWLATLVVPGTKDCPLASTVDPEEIDWIMTKEWTHQSSLSDLNSDLGRISSKLIGFTAEF